MAAGTTLKLGLKQGSRPTLVGVSSFRSHVAVGTLNMSSDQKLQSSSAKVAEPVPSPFGDELDQSHGAPRRSSPTPGNTHRRRRSTKGTMPAIIKRSSSTPNVRGLASTDTAGMSLADKRRNKLGYHRTSVACGHCRRRKIRCLLAPDDLHGRCSNCIRLKKECNFFPVDQQPQLERRPRSGSKNDGISNEASTSSSSSPALAGGHMIEQVESFNHYRPMPVTSGPDFSGPTDPLSASMISPLGKAPSHYRAFEFSQPPDRTSRWDSYLDHSPASAGLGHPTLEDPSSAYWKFAESPMTPAFSHFSSQPSSSLHYPRDHGSSFSLAGSREDLGWPLPARSMSFGQVEDLPMNYQHHYHEPFQHDLRRRISTDIYAPPSLDTSNTSSRASISEPHSAPVSAPVGGQPRHHFGFPPAWNSLPGHHIGAMVGKGPEGISGWYSEPSPLAKVQEEDAGPVQRGNPAAFYSSAGHHPG